jgi:hypothetical protein
MRKLAALALGLAAFVATAATAATSILFVGNSFTYTRPPVLQYNVANVVDLNLENSITKPLGADPALPQPWGGIPGAVEALADQAGIDFEIQHSLRGGATLRGHFINSNPAGWDLRSNIARQRWDVVILQGNSTEAVARAGGDPNEFRAYVDKHERWIHAGAAENYRESQFYPGGSNTLRRIPANPNASPATRVFLYQTWARPDLTYPAGAPYAGEPLETMGHEIRDAYAQAAAANGRIEAVIPVGEAFLRAVQQGVAVRNPYAPEKHGVDLWWHEDRFHSSKHGSYLSALVIFGVLSGVDPASFGATERVAFDLGIDPVDALRLQRVASEQLVASGHALGREPCLHASPRAQGARPCTAR